MASIDHANSMLHAREGAPTARHRDEQTRDSTVAQTCVECDGQLVVDGTETFCPECGLVEMDYSVDHGPEWRSHTAEESAQRSRVGAPVTVTEHDRGLSTEIGYKRDANGNPLSANQRRRFNRLRIQHSRGRFDSKKERNRAYANGEIKRIVSALDFPSAVTERACYLFKRMHEESLEGRGSLDGFASAAVYAACREQGVPSTPHQVADVARVSRAKVLHCYGVLTRSVDDAAPGVLLPNDHIPRLSTALGLSNTTERRAHELACAADDAGLCSGVSPSGFAAACIYAAASERDLRTTQAQVADVADVSTPTVRSHWQTVRDELLDARAEAQ